MADATLAVLERLGETHTELVGELPYDVEDEAIRHIKTVLVATKLDADGCAENVWRSSRNGSRRVPGRSNFGSDWRRTGILTDGYIRFIGSVAGLYQSCLANQPIGPSRSRYLWVARSWTLPGRFIGILSIL